MQNFNGKASDRSAAAGDVEKQLQEALGEIDFLRNDNDQLTKYIQSYETQIQELEAELGTA